MEIYRTVCDAYGEHVEPAVLGEAAGEIHDQYLDATRAHTVLGWKAEVELAGGMARDGRLVPHVARRPVSSTAEELRARILALADEYHAEAFPAALVRAGRDAGPGLGEGGGAARAAGPVRRALDLWLTEGRFADDLEDTPRRDRRRAPCLPLQLGLVGEPPRAAALLSPRLGDRRLQPGDEVVTVAAGFPTTVNPIVLNGLVPVFVDVDLGTYNAQIERVAEAIGPRTRAIVIAHTLGNPFDLEAVTRLAEEHELFLVEDNCDALGARYDGRMTGTFGDLATLSFYPAHQITTGEGGCVLTDRGPLGKIVESLRDWGRDCWCAPGEENTCGKRFEWQLGELPYGYDHKYIYSHVGYNLKLTDSQAAVGLAQLDRLAGFIGEASGELATTAPTASPISRSTSCCRARRRAASRAGSGSPRPCGRRRRSPATRSIEFLEGRRIATRLHVRGQPHASAGVRRRRVPRRGRPRRQRRHRRVDVLGRCLPGPDRRDARLRDRRRSTSSCTAAAARSRVPEG